MGVFHYTAKTFFKLCGAVKLQDHTTIFSTFGANKDLKEKKNRIPLLSLQLWRKKKNLG